MARKAFFLEAQGVHQVTATTFREVCRLDLVPAEPGSYTVTAKGDFRPVADWYSAYFEIRLDVLSMFSANLGRDQTRFYLGKWSDPGPRTFSLMVAATVPYEGGAGGSESGSPPSFPPPRVILSARGEEFKDSRGELSNVRISALPADELVVTTT